MRVRTVRPLRTDRRQQTFAPAASRAPADVRLALPVMALGLGGVLAALLAQVIDCSTGAVSLAQPVLLLGVFALLEQQMVSPFGGQTWAYVALLMLRGAYEPRSARRAEQRSSGFSRVRLRGSVASGSRAGRFPWRTSWTRRTL